MVRAALSRVGGDVADSKRRISAALDRYGAFAGAIRRGDVSAQASGAKVLDSLASTAVQDQLLLRNSADLRRFFSAAISKVDLAAMLSSSAVPVQLAALHASRLLSQHAETLPSTSLPCLVKLLQADGASELAVMTLRNLVRPFGPSTIWQTIHDGDGHEILLAKAESWAQGQAVAAPHLRLLCHLLHSSLAAQRQLLESPQLALRWAKALLELLQLPLSDTDREVVAATVHAMSSMAHFVEHIQQDHGAYHKLAVAAAAALQAGNRLSWTGASNLESLTVTACHLLDTLACITPPHVHHHQESMMATPSQAEGAQTREELLPPSEAEQHGAVLSLATALQRLLSLKRPTLQRNSPGHRVLSAGLKAACVLLLPPHFTHGSGACENPWVAALGPNLTATILALLSKSGDDQAVDTWCWQALYLLQAQLSSGQISQILRHPTVQKVPPTSILTLDPLYCSWSAFRLLLACQAATKPSLHLVHSVYLPAADTHSRQSPSSASPQGQQAKGSSALQAGGQQWAKLGTQRHHLLLPKALPQGNLARYFDLACITAALRCMDGQQGAWEDAWLVLKHALPKLHDEEGAAWTSAIIAALQALAEAAAISCLPTDVCQQLLHLSQNPLSTRQECLPTAANSLPSEVAYGEATSSGGGSKGTLVPPPLQLQENTQLQLWWAVAAAACSGQLGLPSELGETLSSLLDDSSMADVAINLQDQSDSVWAHAAILAAQCPKLYQAVLQQQQQQQQQEHSHSSPEASSCGSGRVQLQLGKQVRTRALQQVLEYLYIGQVKTLVSSEDRAALRKLAHALDLPQLAALAAGTRPLPGASYAPLTLRSIMPSKPVAIPCKIALPGGDSQLPLSQPEQQNEDATQAGSLDGIENSPRASGRVGEVDEPNMPDQQHPRLDDLLGPSRQCHVPDQIPKPTAVSPHFDLMLVPQQRQYCMHSQTGTDGAEPQQEGTQQQEAVPHEDHQVKSVNEQDGSSISNAAAGQWSLQALPAHRALLAATSPYFSAMLSDRWQAGMKQAPDNCSRQMSVAHLPAYDMDVLLAFVHFCCTRKLELLPKSEMAFLGVYVTLGREMCGKCWQSRLVVRLSSAAEAWMVPQLQQQCLDFLISSLPCLSGECQAAIYQDISDLQSWGLAQQLADMVS